MISKKFVVEVVCHNSIDGNSPYRIVKAINECLATLKHKKFGIEDASPTVSVMPVEGSLEAAINLVSMLKIEAEQRAESLIEDSNDRSDGSCWCGCG